MPQNFTVAVFGDMAPNPGRGQAEWKVRAGTADVADRAHLRWQIQSGVGGCLKRKQGSTGKTVSEFPVAPAWFIKPRWARIARCCNETRKSVRQGNHAVFAIEAASTHVVFENAIA